MGYNTSFSGVLKFTKELTIPELKMLNNILGEDWRDHPHWGVHDDFYYIDLATNDDCTGLIWNGSEKTGNMVNIINLVINIMTYHWKDFGLTGYLTAQGEEVDDRYRIEMVGNRASEIVAAKDNKQVTCPCCNNIFDLPS